MNRPATILRMVVTSFLGLRRSGCKRREAARTFRLMTDGLAPTCVIGLHQ
jgi:hypothetical protein